MPALCRFFQQGNCRYGDQCRFEHPRGGPSAPSGPKGNQSRNSFQPLENRISSFGGDGRANNQPFGGGGRGNDQSFGRGNQYGSNRGNLFSSGRGDYSGSGRGGSQSGFRSRGGGGPNSRNNQSEVPNAYGLRSKILLDDMQEERPMWVASCYAPGNHPPKQLMGGWPLEQSPEELRLLHYCGNGETSLQNELELALQANKQAQEILGDPRGAIQYIVDGEKEHPNRRDIAAESKKGHRLGLFSRDNQRRRIGVFSEQPRVSPGGQSSWGTGFGQQLNGFTMGSAMNQQPQPNQFAVPQMPVDMQMASPGLPQQSNGFAVPSFGHQSQQIGMSQQDQSTFGDRGFGLNDTNSGIPAQSQVLPSDQPAQLSALGQMNASQLGGFPQLQPNSSFFPPGTSGPTAGVFARQENGFAPNGMVGNDATNGLRANDGPSAFENPNVSASGSGFAVNQPQGSTGVSNGFQMSGVDTGSEGNPIGGNDELRAAYEYVAQTGQFKDGIVPEIAPRKEWIRF